MMRKKILLLLVLLFIVAGVNTWLVTSYRQRNMDSYLAAYLDKEQMLVKAESPKIIIVGGSNAAFGYRSGMIAQATGLPVVNTGLQGGIGIRYYLKAIEPHIKAGDIILISPEYHFFTNGFIGPDTLIQLLLINPPGIKYVSSVEEVRKMIVAFPAVHTRAIKNMVLDYHYNCRKCFKEEEVYFRGAFDENGDYIFGNVEPEYTSTPFTINVKDSPGTFKRQIRLLNQFAEITRSKGAQVVLSFPATTGFGSVETADYFAMLEMTLRKELSFEVIGSPGDSQYDSRYMFDTFYHLNEEGAVIHTGKLLEGLCSLDLPIACAR